MTIFVRFSQRCLSGLFALLSIPGNAAMASDGRIEFIGAIVAPTIDSSRLVTLHGGVSPAPTAMRVQRLSLREALSLHAALLDYFASQVPVGRAAVITISYD